MTENPGAEPAVEHIGEPIMGSVAEAPNVVPAPAAEPVPATAPVAATRPTDVVIVTLFALVAALGDVIAGVAWLVEGDSIPSTAKFLAWAVLLVGLGTAALAALLFTGSRIARTLIALFMIVRIVLHVWAWIVIGSDAAVGAMISILIAGVILIMLFSRESTAFLTGMDPAKK